MKGLKTKGRIAACIGAAALTAPLVLGGTLFTTPIIKLTPQVLDFGAVPYKSTVTNTVLLENWGGGKLIGKATVPKPFKVIGGATYRLGASDVQVVTITYTPSASGVDTNVVKFTGASGAMLPVVGKLSGPPPELPLGK